MNMIPANWRPTARATRSSQATGFRAVSSASTIRASMSAFSYNASLLSRMASVILRHTGACCACHAGSRSKPSAWSVASGCSQRCGSVATECRANWDTDSRVAGGGCSACPKISSVSLGSTPKKRLMAIDDSMLGSLEPVIHSLKVGLATPIWRASVLSDKLIRLARSLPFQSQMSLAR